MHENCVSKEEYNRVLAELALLQDKVVRLEALLERFMGPHAPPSTREARYPRREPTWNPIGKPKESNGATRKLGEPDQRVRVKRSNCRKCRHALGEPFEVEKRFSVEIPPPQKPIVTEFELEKYICPACGLAGSLAGITPKLRLIFLLASFFNLTANKL